MACATMLFAANTLSVLVTTMREAGLSRQRILEFLERIDRANAATLDEDGLGIVLSFTESIRDTLGAND